MHGPAPATGSHAPHPVPQAATTEHTEIDDLGLKVATCIPILGELIALFFAKVRFTSEVDSQIKAVKQLNHFVLASVIRELLTIGLCIYLYHEGVIETVNVAICISVFGAYALWKTYGAYQNQQLLGPNGALGLGMSIDLKNEIYKA